MSILDVDFGDENVVVRVHFRVKYRPGGKRCVVFTRAYKVKGEIPETCGACGIKGREFKNEDELVQKIELLVTQLIDPTSTVNMAGFVRSRASA